MYIFTELTTQTNQNRQNVKQTTMSTLEANAILLIDSKRREQTKHYSKHTSMETTAEYTCMMK